MNKSRPEISQQEFEEIEHYLLDEFSVSQREEFERRMELDSTLREEVLLQQKLMISVELGSLNEKIKASKTSKLKPIKLRTENVWLVAATIIGIVLVSFMGYLFLKENNSDTYDKLYTAYFYPDPGLPVLMSSTEDFDFYDGMVSYKEGKYEEAISVWSKLPESKLKSDTLLYYQGVAFMNLNKPDDASVFLDMVTTDTLSEFQAKAAWYRALIHVQKNESALARELLETLLPEQRAKDLLEELRK